ncbi:MAG: undecaprenyldiphospho-muramoylpentapeptide beta-N-acetylglucosaminyltransferase [Rikenellaceae bacterium]
MELKEIAPQKRYRVIISGGGTGGHFYPAVAIAERLKALYGEDIEILFVGAYCKMEMEKVPPLGWNIIGLHIAGLQRKFTAKNLTLPFKVIGSYVKSSRIISRFKPNIVVGFGGYVTLPILSCAARNGIPTMIWEGNSYPGMANRSLAKRAVRVFVPHSGMSNYFDSAKMVVSGSPLRGGLCCDGAKREEAYDYFSIDRSKPTLFVTGGSLGTSVLNNALLAAFDELASENKINIIWQSGSAHNAAVQEAIKGRKPSNFWVSPFVNRMDLAYNVADLVVARSGASTLSELALIGRAAILVPSSNVPDDHQTKNAMTFVSGKAAHIVTDAEATEKLIPLALSLLENREQIAELEENIKKFAQPESAKIIVDEIAKYL